MRFSVLLPLFTLSALATAHSMHQKRVPTLEELAREEIRSRERVVRAKDCEPEIREHLAMRMKKRAEIMKREAVAAAARAAHIARATSPHYTTIQNTTCLTAPEVVEGPYYVSNEFIRQDIRESQPGVELLMDIGVMDTGTCTPMNYTFVEIWHANSTGEYGAYNTPTFNASETWLRGGWYTDENGMVEVTTVYPGYYDGRCPHVHIMVHNDWSQSTNGTLISHAGSLVHVGQTYFNESWNDEVFKTSPYDENTHTRTYNSDDSILKTAFQNGYDAYTTLQYLNGNDLSGGLVGYLTVGVDTSSTYSITSKNYNEAAANSTSSGNGTSSSNGSTSGNGTSSGNGSSSSSAAAQWKGWENTLGLSLLMFAFFGYKAQLHLG